MIVGYFVAAIVALVPMGIMWLMTGEPDEPEQTMIVQRSK